MYRTSIALVGVLLAVPAVAQDGGMAACELDRPVVFAGLDYDSAKFHAAVAGHIIEMVTVAPSTKSPGRSFR
jgi:glycine betaine/proline transport system substrate-binding protein